MNLGIGLVSSILGGIGLGCTGLLSADLRIAGLGFIGGVLIRAGGFCGGGIGFVLGSFVATKLKSLDDKEKFQVFSMFIFAFTGFVAGVCLERNYIGWWNF